MLGPPEIGWVLACLRSIGRGTCPAPPDDLDWNGLLASAEAEGLAAALGFACKAGVPAGLPRTVQERLHRELARGTASHLLMSQELGRLLRGFEAAAVPVIPLKGLVLAETLYPHPALRPSSDLDLLVHREGLLRVDDLLRGLGYRRLADAHSFHFDLAYDRATVYEGVVGIRVDLHWGLTSDPRYAWNEREGLTVWDRALPIRVAGERALGLCPEDLLLYLALHLAVHHGLAGLSWYWDLSLLLDRRADALDWRTVLARASRWRVRTALFFALLGLEVSFGAAAPAAVMARLKPRGPRARAMGWLLRHRGGERRVRLEHLIAVLLVDRGRDLLGPLWRALCPPPAWVRARYDGAGSSLFRGYVAHYRRLGEVLSASKEGLARR